MDDFDVEWAKTGMVSNPEIIQTLREKIREHNIKIVVDPVMIAASGSPLIKKDSIGELKKLLRQAELVTPNIPEAEELSGIKIEKVGDMKKAAEKISQIEPGGVLIKGGHLEAPKIHNVLFHEGEFTKFKEERVTAKEIHGTGCTFSAAIAANLAKGNDMQDAVREAGKFMVDAVRGRLEIGGGAETVNPMARLWKVTGGGEEVEEVQKAAKELVGSPEFARLIPEVGTNVAMAPENAKKGEEVIGLTGRIIRVGNKPYLSGAPAPGGSEHVANFVLSAMKHDPAIRAGLNVRFSEEILERCQGLGLQISSFDRQKEPPNTKTMRWGTKKAIEKFGGVPDLIYDRGAIGKEPMIRLLGKKATEVSQIALRIAKTKVT